MIRFQRTDRTQQKPSIISGLYCVMFGTAFVASIFLPEVRTATLVQFGWEAVTINAPVVLLVGFVLVGLLGRVFGSIRFSHDSKTRIDADDEIKVGQHPATSTFNDASVQAIEGDEAEYMPGNVSGPPQSTKRPLATDEHSA